jgi:Porin subfamily
MKMVKSLLLGSAAGLVAVAGAQAADLPVKAKPVEYVKVCSIYGAGFFYIPGTDTCIKIGGWVRAEYAFQSGNSDVPANQGSSGRNTRIDTNEIAIRARWVTSLDVRTQTEYGTLRAYTRAGFQTSTGDTAQGKIYTERAFIQFAGFTLGKSQSYFDFMSGAFCYGCGFMGNGSQTGAAGILLMAYTATLGNGITATISAEDGTIRRNTIWDTSNDPTNALVIGNGPGPLSNVDDYTLPTGSGLVQGTIGVGDYAATQIPDIVGALRVDQAWGSAQVAAALHQNRAGNFGNNATGAGGGTPFLVSPADAYGWAAMAGIVVNVPWNKGDKFWVEGTVAQGAGSYAGVAAPVGQTSVWDRFNGTNVAAAWGIDSVFGNSLATGGQTGQQLTTYWSIAAAFEHYWTPALRTDIYGSYLQADFNGTATTLFCSSAQSPVRGLAVAGQTQVGAATNGLGVIAGCNPDFNLINVGTRTIWNPAPQFDIGVEVMYSRIETKMDSNLVAINFGGGGGRAPGLYAPSSENVFSGILRFQRNFWP